MLQNRLKILFSETAVKLELSEKDLLTNLKKKNQERMKIDYADVKMEKEKENENGGQGSERHARVVRVTVGLMSE